MGVAVDVVLGEPERRRVQGTRFSTVIELEETTSTSSVLAQMAEEGAPEGLVVVADYQTRGRGRFDRRWESPRGSSLLFSVLMRPGESELPVARRHLALAALSLAMADAAREVAGVELRLKWPNDLVSAARPSGEQKVAGVLAEVVGSPEPAIVVGMGVNVHWAPGPDLLEGTAAAMPATSIDALAGSRVDRGELFASCLLALDRLYGDWPLVARRYREASATLGCRVEVETGGRAKRAGEVTAGLAVGIDDEGALIIRTGSGQLVKVAAGDVAHARGELTSWL